MASMTTKRKIPRFSFAIPKPTQVVALTLGIVRTGSRCPTTRHCSEFLAILRPVVERLGVEIRTVGPLQSSERWVEFNGVEHLQILKRREHLAFQDRAKINSLLTPVSEQECQRIRPDDFKLLHAMDGVTHLTGSLHRNGSILSGGLPDFVPLWCSMHARRSVTSEA